jgi:aspartate aminotransferase, mitochondrial
MFCFSGLTVEQVGKLKDIHHVYLTKDGRISMAGVTTGNVEYIAKAIVDVTRD